MKVHTTSTAIQEYHLNQHQPEKLQFAIHDLKSYLQKHESDTTKAHIHSFYQIIWFKQGTGKHFVDFNGYDVKPNTIFCIAKNQVHFFDAITKYEGVLIHFNEVFLQQQDQLSALWVQSNLFANVYQQPYSYISPLTAGLLQEYVAQMERELNTHDDFGKETILRLVLKLMLIHIQRERNVLESINPQLPHILDEKRLLLMNFSSLIEAHYTKPTTIHTYASMLFVSVRTLSDVTRLLLGKSPLQMVHERCILEAKRLLLHSNLQVSQIGYQLGFDDPSYFVKYFKKYTQISPSEFRKLVS